MSIIGNCLRNSWRDAKTPPSHNLKRSCAALTVFLMAPAPRAAQCGEDLGGHMPTSHHPQFAPAGQLQLPAFPINQVLTRIWKLSFLSSQWALLSHSQAVSQTALQSSTVLKIKKEKKMGRRAGSNQLLLSQNRAISFSSPTLWFLSKTNQGTSWVIPPPCKDTVTAGWGCGSPPQLPLGWSLPSAQHFCRTGAPQPMPPPPWTPLYILHRPSSSSRQEMVRNCRLWYEGLGV